jgi:excisionase family DNA binding protein
LDVNKMISAPLTFESAPDVLLAEEAAELARISIWALYRAIRRGDLRAVKAGKSLRIMRSELMRWLDGCPASQRVMVDAKPQLPGPRNQRSATASTTAALKARSSGLGSEE